MVDSIEFESDLFGKKILICVYDAPAQVVSDIYPLIYSEALRLQSIFNFFDDKSELNILNTRRTVAVSSELLEVITQALTFCELSQGKYDITHGKQFLARKQKKELPLVYCSYKDVKIRGTLVELSHDDVLLDLGSIAKGYIVDKLCEYMLKLGLESFFIDARGDMRVVGAHSEDVTIQHPRDSTKTLHSLKLTNEAVATSGDYMQFDESYSKSHIIGKSDLISVSVIAPNAMLADALASVMFLAPQRDRKNIAQQYLSCRILTIDGNLHEESFNDVISE